jgi:hypothetical protein
MQKGTVSWSPRDEVEIAKTRSKRHGMLHKLLRGTQRFCSLENALFSTPFSHFVGLQ